MEREPKFLSYGFSGDRLHVFVSGGLCFSPAQ
nr:MAG TPA: hypothetical protein [Caudoviricetes sp.]